GRGESLLGETNGHGGRPRFGALAPAAAVDHDDTRNAPVCRVLRQEEVELHLAVTIAGIDEIALDLHGVGHGSRPRRSVGVRGWRLSGGEREKAEGQSDGERRRGQETKDDARRRARGSRVFINKTNHFFAPSRLRIFASSRSQFLCPPARGYPHLAIAKHG